MATEVTRDCFLRLGFSELRVKFVLPHAIHVLGPELAEAGFGKEHPGLVHLWSHDEVLEEEPAKFFIDREQARIRGLVSFAVVRDVQGVLSPFESGMRSEFRVAVLNLAVANVDILKLQVADFADSTSFLELRSDDCATTNILDGCEFVLEGL